MRRTLSEEDVINEQVDSLETLLHTHGALATAFPRADVPNSNRVIIASRCPDRCILRRLAATSHVVLGTNYIPFPVKSPPQATYFVLGS